MSKNSTIKFKPLTTKTQEIYFLTHFRQMLFLSNLNRVGLSLHLRSHKFKNKETFKLKKYQFQNFKSYSSNSSKALLICPQIVTCTRAT